MNLFLRLLTLFAQNNSQIIFNDLLRSMEYCSLKLQVPFDTRGRCSQDRVVFICTSLTDLAGPQSTKTSVEGDRMWQYPWIWLSIMLELHDTLLSLLVPVSHSPPHTYARAHKHHITTHSYTTHSFPAPLPFAHPSPSASIRSIFTSNECPY